jgi:NADPH:quinone reductase-like Zn-dependent oxidoreductase
MRASLWAVRAAVLNAYDRPPEPGTFEAPEPDGEGIVQVAVAGLNPIDLYTAAGGLPTKPPLPSVVGREGVGRLSGRRVYFDRSVPPFGSMAERTRIDPATAIEVPDDVDDPLAVCFGIAGLAAWLGLEWRGHLAEGETVLVLGASGVVGQIAVQAARLLGAGRVVAGARDPDGRERAQSELGADAAVALDTGGDELVERFRDAAGGQVDLVVDPIWGPAAVAALEALGEDGRLVQIGNAAGASTEMPARPIRTHIRSIVGHTNFSAPHDVKRAAFRTMCEHAAAGELVVPVEIVGLDDVTDAWRRQAESPHHKLVIRP